MKRTERRIASYLVPTVLFQEIERAGHLAGREPSQIVSEILIRHFWQNERFAVLLTRAGIVDGTEGLPEKPKRAELLCGHRQTAFSIASAPLSVPGFEIEPPSLSKPSHALSEARKLTLADIAAEIVRRATT